MNANVTKIMCVYLICKRRRRLTKILWVHPILEARCFESAFVNLNHKLRDDSRKFFNYFRMSISSFDELLSRLGNRIKHQDIYSAAIPPIERLALTLRFLATGSDYADLYYTCRMGVSTISGIIKEVCTAIWEELQDECLPQPTTEKWLQIAAKFQQVYLLPDKSKAGKRKTKVKKNTLNPVFEETLSFVQPLASLSARTLWLSVWHADMFGRNDFLGEVTLPLADVVFDDPAPMWYKLHERTEQFDEQQGSRGDLIIGLKLELTEGARGKGTLHVLVKEAKNLVATKPNGLADVFCKSYLLPERGRLAKQKTAVCRRTLSPVWEHTFTYRGLAPHELAQRALELSLWDRDRLASNDFMGGVRLSLGSGTYMGANVNWMDSTGKEVTLWQTMMQRPNFWVEGSLQLRPNLSN